MDILYYSNYCKHCQKILDFIRHANLMKDMNFICIDKRSRDARTGQIIIEMDNGKRLMLPPNIHEVPSLLLVGKNHSVIQGDDIIKHFEPKVVKKIQDIVEPSSFVFSQSSNNANIVSEQYTYYHSSPEELSAKGNGANRQMYNYVRPDMDSGSIYTPPDSYRPDKITEDSIEKLQNQRNNELPKLNANMFNDIIGGGGGGYHSSI
jgi:hypothetical protein